MHIAYPILTNWYTHPWDHRGKLRVHSRAAHRVVDGEQVVEVAQLAFDPLLCHGDSVVHTVRDGVDHTTLCTALETAGAASATSAVAAAAAGDTIELGDGLAPTAPATAVPGAIRWNLRGDQPGRDRGRQNQPHQLGHLHATAAEPTSQRAGDGWA